MIPIRDLNPTRIRPVVTIALIGLTIAAFFFWQPQASELENQRFVYANAAIACEMTSAGPLTLEELQTGTCTEGSTPAEELFPDKNVYLAALVSIFLHAGIVHLAGNVWFLWIFGNNVEEAFGRVPFLVFYLATGLIATAAFVVANPDSTIPLVGASGAIAGVLGAYLVLFPTHKVLSLFTVIFVPVPAVVFLGLWFIMQFSVASVSPEVAWQAHVGGFIAGVLITLPLRSRLLGRVQTLHDPLAAFRRV